MAGKPVLVTMSGEIAGPIEEIPITVGPPPEGLVRKRIVAEGKTAFPIHEGEALFILDPSQANLMCQHRELDVEANEWVYCSLPKHPPSKKCVPGRRESAG